MEKVCMSETFYRTFVNAYSTARTLVIIYFCNIVFDRYRTRRTSSLALSAGNTSVFAIFTDGSAFIAITAHIYGSHVPRCKGYDVFRASSCAQATTDANAAIDPCHPIFYMDGVYGTRGNTVTEAKTSVAATAGTAEKKRC